MSNDKVVGVGGDGQSSHWKVVSRDCAVELGRKTRDKAIGHLIFLQERLDEQDMVMTTLMAALQGQRQAVSVPGLSPKQPPHTHKCTDTQDKAEQKEARCQQLL